MCTHQQVVFRHFLPYRCSSAGGLRSLSVLIRSLIAADMEWTMQRREEEMVSNGHYLHTIETHVVEVPATRAKLMEAMLDEAVLFCSVWD